MNITKVVFFLNTITTILVSIIFFILFFFLFYLVFVIKLFFDYLILLVIRWISLWESLFIWLVLLVYGLVAALFGNVNLMGQGVLLNEDAVGCQARVQAARLARMDQV